MAFKKSSKKEEAKVEEPKKVEEIKKAEAPKAATKKVASPKSSYVGKEIDLKIANGAEFRGVCTAERETPSGKQVFVKLGGLVSRYFNVTDIIK